MRQAEAESELGGKSTTPLRPGQLQASLVTGAAILIAALLLSIVWGADHPLPAAGIALQTMAGLLAAIQLWANNASDSGLRWTAEQIARNRWHIARLFDGTLRSLLCSAAWCGLGYVVIKTPKLASNAIVGWALAVPALLIFLGGIVALLGSLLMYGSALLVEQKSLPDGRAATALQARIAERDWVWPLVGLAFLLGGILQLAVA